MNTRRLSKTGTIADARVVHPDAEITLISAEGIVIRTPIESIPQMGRATLGAIVMRLEKSDGVASIARLANDSEAVVIDP